MIKSKVSYFASESLRTILLCVRTIIDSKNINPDKL
jgi:hypothetical protein